MLGALTMGACTSGERNVAKSAHRHSERHFGFRVSATLSSVVVAAFTPPAHILRHGECASARLIHILYVFSGGRHEAYVASGERCASTRVSTT